MTKVSVDQPSVDQRGKAMAMISSWVLEEKQFPNEVFERSPAAIRLAERVAADRRANLRDVEELLDKYEESVMIGKQLSLIAAALIHCWSDSCGVPSHILLSDLAITEALDHV
jgi:hypothetical protein